MVWASWIFQRYRSCLSDFYFANRKGIDMSYERTIVCLANSRKISGRCIAGKIIENNQPQIWFRPVSARDTHEISEEERRYSDGNSPRVLDLIRIPCLSAQPLNHQPENHLINPNNHWIHIGAFPVQSLPNLVDNPTSL